MANENTDRQLSNLLRTYRDACPDIEGGANFVPGLWQKIEARRTLPMMMRRWVQVFVSGSVAATLAMSLFLLTAPGPGFTTSYVEALANDDPQELMAYADTNDQPGEMQWQ